MQAVLQPYSGRTIGQFLIEGLMNQDTLSFVGAIAFAKRSGIRHLMPYMHKLIQRGGEIRLAIGVDQQGTSYEALSDLLGLGDTVEVYICHDETPFVSFHPKFYMFIMPTHAQLIVGSGNLTQGGLFTNDEMALVLDLDLSDNEDRRFLEDISIGLESWLTPNPETVRRLDDRLLAELAENDYTYAESSSDSDINQVDQHHGQNEGRVSLFGRTRRPAAIEPSHMARTSNVHVPHGSPVGFVMTLMRTDVGVGQTTPGTSRRSPEVFIPLSARDNHPEFWGWRNQFFEDPNRSGKWDRTGVPMLVQGNLVLVNMMNWPVKHDFRLRSEALRSAGHVGDLICIKRVEGKRFIYDVSVIDKNDDRFAEYSALCINPTRNSDRRWGYFN